MTRKRVGRWVISVVIGGCTVLVPVTSAMAQDGTTVQGSNSSDASTASSSASSDTNHTTFRAGPATGDDGGSASQVGDNAVSGKQDTAARSGDASAGSQVTGAVNSTGTVQKQNSSNDTTAESGAVTVESDLFQDAGPLATASNVSQATQNGDNAIAAAQIVSAVSGDAIAGTQVTGLVNAWDVTVQAQQSSVNIEATSGSIDFQQNADANAGPFAVDDGGSANASQVGDNAVDVSQAIAATTGDAVAASQVTGIVDAARAKVQLANSAETATADTGNIGEKGDEQTTDANAGPAADAGEGTANASQIGDNDLAKFQSIKAATGDAVAGSQVAGVADSRDATLQVSGSSFDATAGSGAIDATNMDPSQAGPAATTVTGTANASQNGDNSLDATQAIGASTGDAVAGSAVLGAVGASDLKVQASNAAEGEGAPNAQSGNVDATNGSDSQDLLAGAIASSDDGTANGSQIGDNAMTVGQGISAATGDAVAGSQMGNFGGHGVTAQLENDSTDDRSISGNIDASNLADGQNAGADVIAGPFASTGDGTANASQLGDNALALDQAVNATTGDAVAGSQVAGVAGDVRGANVQLSNSSDSSQATSSDVTGTNTVDLLESGPLATSGSETASASQIGDNAASLAQDATVSSGDAVAGSQVVGMVATDPDVQAQNAADDAGALSETADGVNNAEGQVGAFADGDAQSSQNGDNAVDAAQSASAGSGDTVAGSQVFGQAL